MIMKMAINALKANTRLGIHEWEKGQRRRVVIDIELFFDASAVLASGSIQEAIDYHDVTQEICAFVEEGSFELIETLAFELLEKIKLYPSVISAEVKVAKPGAVVVADDVSIACSWSKGH